MMTAGEIADACFFRSRSVSRRASLVSLLNDTSAFSSRVLHQRCKPRERTSVKIHLLSTMIVYILTQHASSPTVLTICPHSSQTLTRAPHEWLKKPFHGVCHNISSRQRGDWLRPESAVIVARFVVCAANSWPVSSQL